MRLAISIPQRVGAGGFDQSAFRNYLVRAEELGFEGAWVQEQLIGSGPVLRPLDTLAFAAACTDRIRLGCAVLVTPLHSPVHLAAEIATVDQLSRGRLDVGVVAGGKGRNYAAFGLSPEGAISRFREGLELMKRLWAQPEVTAESRFWRLDSVRAGLTPFQRPHPPIWFGGHHPDALRRAVQLGQGFIGAGSQTTAQFAEQAGVIRRLLASEQAAPGFQIAKRVYVAVDEDVERARTRTAEALDELYGDGAAGRLLPVAVIGPPEACLQGLQQVADLGPDLILLNPLFDEAAQLERLATEVVPQLVAR